MLGAVRLGFGRGRFGCWEGLSLTDRRGKVWCLEGQRWVLQKGGKSE